MAVWKVGSRAARKAGLKAQKTVVWTAATTGKQKVALSAEYWAVQWDGSMAADSVVHSVQHSADSKVL